MFFTVRLMSVKSRDDAATLKEIFLLLTQSSEPKASDLQASSPPPDIHRSSAPPNIISVVELLLDLAFLSLHLQHHQTASDCLKELRATDVTVGQRVMTECVQCELELNKHREGMENYSRSSVEFQALGTYWEIVV
ncbi:hypothetical protein G5714_013840 [Onychostoma macrolepis]|uniref:Uncharacterized protein n=1 Tax=Onychostoma macrolepis TaxID=369639 RepID=A0A7J6CFU0_9TELE|nr:hypothetical protein G5714_013840 [Onychostoma macrolepis]